ncbi:hypothetical protein OSH18_09890 [Escherichia ruysiae]|nr:hypothetical protein OSH18_09890 [Escherichia ruysiae]
MAEKADPAGVTADE